MTEENKTKLETARNESQLWQLLYGFCLLGCGAMFLVMLFFGHPLSLVMKLVFLAVFVLTVRFWTGGLVLLLAILHLISMPPEQNGMLVILKASSWIVVSICLVALICAFRTLREHDSSPVWHVLKRAPELLDFQHPVLFRFAGQLLKVLLAPLIAGVIAFAALAFLPTANARNVYGLKASSFRLIFIGFGIFAAVSVIWLVMNEWLWRSISKSQASVYVRGIAVKDMFRDFRRIAKRRATASARRPR